MLFGKCEIITNITNHIYEFKSVYEDFHLNLLLLNL